MVESDDKEVPTGQDVDKKFCWKCTLFGDKVTGLLGIVAGAGILAVGIDLMTNGRFLRMFSRVANAVPASVQAEWSDAEFPGEGVEDEAYDTIDNSAE